jgi:PAS domain S-box-containing protein
MKVGGEREVRLLAGGRGEGAPEQVITQITRLADASGHCIQVIHDLFVYGYGERVYREIVELQTELICRFRPDCTLTFVNEAYARAFGRSRESLIGRSFLELVPEASWDAIRNALSALTPASPRQSYAHPVLYPDGKEGWQHWTDLAIFDERGRAVEFQSVGRDVTELKTIEAKLRASEERYRATAEGSLDAFYLLQAVRDAQGAVADFEFIDVNELGARMISRKREEVIGRRLCELLPVNRKEGFFDKYLWVMQSGRPIEEEFEIQSPQDGLRARWLRHQVVPAGDGVAITSRDITPRKQAEQQLRESNLELRAILDAVPSFIYFKDENNRILRVNRAAAAEMGLSIEQIEGRHTSELFPPSDAEAYLKDDREVIESGEPKLGIIERYSPHGGKPRWVATDKVPVRDENGQVTGVLAVATDITALREREAERAMVEQGEEERLRIARELHDGIGQDLSGLRMLTESLRRKAEQSAPQLLAKVLEVTRLLGEANTELRRVISGMTPEPIPASDLRAALHQLSANVQILFEIETTAECDKRIPPVDDKTATHLLRIAQEAAYNAAKHGRPRRIRLSLAVEPTYLCLQVIDDGIGFSATRNPDGPAGRGLRIMRYRAEQIGAQLMTLDDPLAGTTVRCTLPLPTTLSL